MSKETPLLKLKNVSKFYYNKGLVASGFSKVSLEFNLGEFVVTLKRFLKAIPAAFILLFKVITYYLKKPFKKD